MKKLFTQLKKCNTCDLNAMGLKIGLGRFSLARSIRTNSLKVRDLKKCVELSGEKLVIKYKGQYYEI